MSRPTERETCRKCGRHRDAVGRMSWTGQCAECGDAELVANVRELKAHSGPRFERWRLGIVKAFGVTPPATTPATGVDLEAHERGRAA